MSLSIVEPARQEVLVSVTVVEPAEAAAEFEPIGEISLRGVADPVPLFRALIRDSSPAE
jgi:class 3 adenylate cyclase